MQVGKRSASRERPQRQEVAAREAGSKGDEVGGWTRERSETIAQLTGLSSREDPSNKRRDSQIRCRDLLSESKRSIVLGEQALDLLDAGEKTDGGLFFAVEEVGEEGSGDDLVEPGGVHRAGEEGGRGRRVK